MNILKTAMTYCSHKKRNVFAKFCSLCCHDGQSVGILCITVLVCRHSFV